MFIGQERIWKELDGIIPAMQGGLNRNMILRAPSGYGKTKMARIIALAIAPEDFDYCLPNEEGTVQPDYFRRIIVIDEVHTLVSPEVLYPFMDDGKHIFILCSNEFGQLKDPLVNRCFDFIFEPYRTEELAKICYLDFKERGYSLPQEIVMEVARNCNGVPRIARSITDRLCIVFQRTKSPESVAELKQVMADYLQIEDGLNPLHRRYLDYLRKVGRASLDAISFATWLDKNTIRKEIEPVLLDKLLISITSRGRQLL